MTDVLPDEFPRVDPQRRCPKCGGDASLKHDNLHSRFTLIDTLRYPGGLVIRRCERCDYRWYETPLDTAPVTREELRERHAAREARPA